MEKHELTPRAPSELRQLRSQWARELRLPGKILLFLLVLVTYGMSMTAIGACNLAATLRRRVVGK